MQPAEKKKEAVSALIKIAVVEAVILAVVVGVYLYTDNMTYLIGGIIGSQIVCVPMFLRWARETGPALKPPPPESER